MKTETLQSRPSFLKKNLIAGLTVSTVLLLVIMVLSAGLHFYNIQSIGDANAYYTAAVKSMLGSWSNFFFVAAEPGGSVTVDKPPLGLWIEAAFAYFLGVSGFSVSLPNILAGLLGIPLLYWMVKKYMGELAGLVAAFVMAITPVFVATNRNNTMDGMLVFTLLLAAWAFMRAAETGRLRWLLLGAFIVGLGFNIKMMQAFLPLPAFYALYFFGSKAPWRLKAINLGLASILLAAVSLSWAVVVDLTPADQRPYIGSSDNNTVMGLIFGHNGISRLENNGGPGENGPQNGQTLPALPQNPASPVQPARQGPPPHALEACAGSAQGTACSFTTQNGNTIDGTCITPPDLDVLACAPQGMMPQNGPSPAGQAPYDTQGGGSQFSQETGEPGVLRFFTTPLSKQMSWLLPFALISLLLALFGSRIKLPIESGVHKALLLWGGWLLTCVVFFSIVSGIFHSYYAIMLAPALGAMVGIGFAQLWSWGRQKNWAGALLVAAGALTIAFQVFAMYQYREQSWWMLGVGILFLAGSISMIWMRRAAFVSLLASMLIIPMYWTAMTSVADSDINLPSAYKGASQPAGTDGTERERGQGDGPAAKVSADLLAYLEANTQAVEYLVAVPSSQLGSQLVLATGRPVLFMGGFGGQDDIVSADDLGAMVANGELRYVLYGGERGSKPEITNWLSTSCSVMLDYSEVNLDNPAPQTASGPSVDDGNPGNQTLTLYSCK